MCGTGKQRGGQGMTAERGVVREYCRRISRKVAPTPFSHKQKRPSQKRNARHHLDGIPIGVSHKQLEATRKRKRPDQVPSGRRGGRTCQEEELPWTARAPGGVFGSGGGFNSSDSRRRTLGRSPPTGHHRHGSATVSCSLEESAERNPGRLVCRTTAQAIGLHGVLSCAVSRGRHDGTSPQVARPRLEVEVG